ncbi:uncharacterized protein LOC131166656 [Malania oleifera]|uniref:uncharacterized protein LOC131166656 n=1 Tax=Malania oleifera TaxID=397392 RepID=UPI0025ADB958|nr:uncharacterized protein LOC131166656 [Malania oleifera]
MVDASCGGTFLTKHENKARAHFKNLTKNSQQHAAATCRPSQPSTSNLKGVYELATDHDLAPTLHTIVRKLDQFLSLGQQPHLVACAEVSAICSDPSHTCYNFPNAPPPLELASAATTFQSGRMINNRVGEKLNKGKGKDKMGEKPNAESCTPSSSKSTSNPETPPPSAEGALPHYVFPAPSPTALQAHSKSKKKTNTQSIMDTFRKVQINLPLLDFIKQVLAYAKFLKDLCTQKCKSKVHLNKRVRLTEHVSSIL